MSQYRKQTGNCLALLLAAALSGCGRGGDTKPTSANIPAGDPATASAKDQASVANKPPIDTKHPVVVVETSLGKFSIKLNADTAPLSVPNFLTYVTSGHYDGTLVHQVYKGQLFVAGGYDVNVVEKPAGMAVRNEAANGVKNRRGAVAMSRVPDLIDSATCQFFVNVADNPNLDHKDDSAAGYGYCVFGEVTQGMDVVDKIANAEVHDTPDFERTPAEPIVIKSIRESR